MFGVSRDDKFVQTTTSYVFRCHKTTSSPSSRLLVDHIKLSSVTELTVLAELFRQPTTYDGDKLDAFPTFYLDPLFLAASDHFHTSITV